MSATTIDTERLRLRGFRNDDAEELGRLYVDPEIMRHLPGYPSNFDGCLARARGDIATYNAHWERHGYGIWAVEDRAERRLVGRCGLRWLDEFSAVELLYMFDKTHWRRGFATEAAARAIAFGQGERRLGKLIGLTLPENTASRRVLEKSGFAYLRHTQFRNHTVLLFERGK